jgi:hypothetical protein
MSGQAVTLPLGSLTSLQLGTSLRRDIPVGIFDMHAMAGLEGVEGFLSLTYFRTTPVTIDYPAGFLILEDQDSLARRAAQGAQVTVRVDCDGCSTDLLLGIDLPGGQSITVEVDTGSDLGDGNVGAVEGTDETGQGFARYAGPRVVRASDAAAARKSAVPGQLTPRFAA